jgi:branched-chain amino acid transport system permease protein
LVDPGLTLAINFGLFTLILLLRPTGLFTRA